MAKLRKERFLVEKLNIVLFLFEGKKYLRMYCREFAAMSVGT